MKTSSSIIFVVFVTIHTAIAQPEECCGLSDNDKTCLSGDPVLLKLDGSEQKIEDTGYILLIKKSEVDYSFKVYAHVEVPDPNGHPNYNIVDGMIGAFGRHRFSFEGATKGSAPVFKIDGSEVTNDVSSEDYSAVYSPGLEWRIEWKGLGVTFSFSWFYTPSACVYVRRDLTGCTYQGLAGNVPNSQLCCGPFSSGRRKRGTKTFTISGTIMIPFTPPVPGVGCTVEIYDADWGPDTLMCTTTTNNAGFFTARCTGHDFCSDPDPYAIVLWSTCTPTPPAAIFRKRTRVTPLTIV